MFTVLNMMYSSNFHKELARKFNGQVNVDQFFQIYRETLNENIGRVLLN